MSTRERELGMKIFVNLSDEDFADLTNYAKTHYEVGQNQNEKKKYDPNARYLDTATPEVRRIIDEWYDSGEAEKSRKAWINFLEELSKEPPMSEEEFEELLRAAEGDKYMEYYYSEIKGKERDHK